jgi:hypothetical protein
MSEYEGTPISYSTGDYALEANLCKSGVYNQSSLDQAVQVVPKYCPNSTSVPSYPPRYDTLTHGLKSYQGGYFNSKNAYPFSSCYECGVKTVQRPCDGAIDCRDESSDVPTVTKEGYLRYASSRGRPRGIWG